MAFFGGLLGKSFSDKTHPTVTRLLSGSGTYTTPSGCKYIKVKMVGGGGGGGGIGSGGTAQNGGAGGSGIIIVEEYYI